MDAQKYHAWLVLTVSIKAMSDWFWARGGSDNEQPKKELWTRIIFSFFIFLSLIRYSG